jgi:beta-mannosidase
MRLAAALPALIFLVATCASAANPVFQSLNAPAKDNVWHATCQNKSISVPATVPGQIQLDLLRSEPPVLRDGDPYFRSNDLTYRWVALDNWTYARKFRAENGETSSSQLLVFEGLDTVSTVHLNGKFVATTDNMFRRYVWDVTDLLHVDREHENELEIAFESASSYAARKAREYPVENPTSDNEKLQSGVPFRNYMRKEQCSFSWDWGPAFIPQGVWRNAYLVTVPRDAAWIASVSPQVFPSAGRDKSLDRFDVVTQVRLVSGGDLEGEVEVSVPELGARQTKHVRLHGASPRTRVPEENSITVTMSVDVDAAKDLWWPRGYGSQPLFTLEASFRPTPTKRAGRFASVRSALAPISETRRIGFRRIELVTDPYTDRKGSRMHFSVNNVPIFAKGANFVPPDSFDERVTPDVFRNILKSAANANMNMIRNWGGGLYQHDAFYDIADEVGLFLCVCCWRVAFDVCPYADTRLARSVPQKIAGASRLAGIHVCLCHDAAKSRVSGHSG